MQNNWFELVAATKKELSLSEAVIEKDYYLTKTLQLLSEVKNDYFNLVFAGGTCLAKGHRLVKRMSEDCDYKFQKTSLCEGLSKSQYLKALKTFRTQIVDVLENTEFTFGEVAARNEGQYLRIKLNYPSAFEINHTLRPHILLEFTASKIKLQTRELPITTLVEDTLGVGVDIQPCTVNCISAEETAAEKWVGLTRRIAANERGYYKLDPTLVRHIYDLSAIYTANQLGEEFYSITKNIVMTDAQQFKNQYPEYFADPIKEINQSLLVLEKNPEWKQRYADFIETMVYDKTNTRTYEEAVQLLETVSYKVINTIRLMQVQNIQMQKTNKNLEQNSTQTKEREGRAR